MKHFMDQVGMYIEDADLYMQDQLLTRPYVVLGGSLLVGLVIGLVF